MAVPAFLRNLFRSAAKVSNGREREIYRGGTLTVAEPMLMTIKASERGFYRTLLVTRDIDDGELAVPHKLLLDVVRNNVSQADTRRKVVPRLPSVIPRLMRSLRDPDSSAKDYVEIINKDPAMSAAVIKLANSAYFNPASQAINSIELSVVTLGIAGLRTVLSAAVMQPIIQRKSHYFSEFGQGLWQHSLCCAVACEILAHQRGLGPYQAYLMGLTHDIGKITIFSEICKQVQANGGGQSPGYQTFAPLMMQMSAQLSYWIARDWELSDQICAALEQQVDLKAGKRVGPYGHLLFQANLLCEVYASGRHRDPELSQHLIEELALPPEIFETLDQLALEI